MTWNSDDAVVIDQIGRRQLLHAGIEKWIFRCLECSTDYRAETREEAEDIFEYHECEGT